ncbi:MAG: hypothetical protein WEA29_06920 [Acidimicrobiia bacterium]
MLTKRLNARVVRLSALWLVGFAAVGVAGFALTLSTFTNNNRSTIHDQTAAPVVAPHVRRVVLSSLDELVAASDLVVVGTVVGVEPGRVAGDPADGEAGQVQFHDAVIRVDDVLAGSTARDSIRVEVFFLPNSPPGSMTDIASAWWRRGASSVFFVRWDATAPGREAVLPSYDGVYHLPSGVDGPARSAGTAPIAGLEGRTVEEIRAAIRALASD